MNRNLEEQESRDRYTIDAMKRYGGSFVKALAEAFERADHMNFEKLKSAFPEYWQQYEGVGIELEKQLSENHGTDNN